MTNDERLFEVPVPRHRDYRPSELEAGELRRRLHPLISEVGADRETRHAGERRFESPQRLIAQAVIGYRRSSHQRSSAQRVMMDVDSAARIRPHDDVVGDLALE